MPREADDLTAGAHVIADPSLRESVARIAALVFDSTLPARTPSGRGRSADYQPPRLFAGVPAEERSRLAARLVERGASDLPLGAKARRVAALTGQEPADVALVVAEEAHRTVKSRARREKREVVELGRQIARVSLLLRRRPLACDTGRHRRASASSSPRRRGTRRSTGAGDRAGPGDPDPDSDDPPGEPDALPAGRVLAGLILVVPS